MLGILSSLVTRVAVSGKVLEKTATRKASMSFVGQSRRWGRGNEAVQATVLVGGVYGSDEAREREGNRSELAEVVIVKCAVE